MDVQAVGTALAGGAGSLLLLVGLGVTQASRLKRLFAVTETDTRLSEASNVAITLLQSELERTHTRSETLYTEFMRVSNERNEALKTIQELTVQVLHLEHTQKVMQQQMSYLIELTTSLMDQQSGDFRGTKAMLKFWNDSSQDRRQSDGQSQDGRSATRGSDQS